jgi:hypothetical protein
MPERQTESFDQSSSIDHPMSEQLAAYATALALGHAPADHYADIAAHVEGCLACQVDLDDLLEVIEPVFAGNVVEKGAVLPAARSVPQAIVNQEHVAEHGWLVEAGRLLVFFSEALIRGACAPQLAGRARGQLLYRYVQEPGSVADLEVAIEVYAEDASERAGRVRVSVDVPSRGPLDQIGSMVLLHAGDAHWEGETDESGQVDFAPVPLAALPHLRVEIAPFGKRQEVRG